MRIKVLHICDTPDGLMDLADIAHEKLDLIITSGDLPRAVYERVQQAFPKVPMLGVRGNHDSPTDLTVEEDLHLRVVDVGGVKLGGFQGSWRYKPAGRYLYSDNEVAVALDRFPGVDIMVTHNPPALPGHEVLDDIHNGFLALVEYCSRHGVKYLFHGHSNIEKQSRMGDTTVIGSYGRQVVEIEV